MNRLNALVVVAAVVLPLATSCSRKGKGKASEIPSVRLATVLPADSSSLSLSLPGRLKPAHESMLSFRVSGCIASLAVSEGDHVSEGQRLATLDDADYQVQLSAAKAKLDEVEAEASRVMALWEDSATSALAYDKARHGLRQAQAALRHAEDEVAYCTLRAPYAGIIQSRQGQVGETVGAGMAVLTIVSDGEPEVEVNLAASDYLRLTHAISYSCDFHLYPHQTYRLTPASSAPKANANGLYTVRLRLIVGEGQSLPPLGTSATVHISFASTGEEGDLLLSVPEGAVVRGEDGNPRVYAFNEGDSTLAALTVTVVSYTHDGQCLIRPLDAPGNNGKPKERVNEGARVVSSGAHHVSDGQRVCPLPPETETNVGGLL